MDFLFWTAGAWKIFHIYSRPKCLVATNPFETFSFPHFPDESAMLDFLHDI